MERVTARPIPSPSPFQLTWRVETPVTGEAAFAPRFRVSLKISDMGLTAL